eukprot:scaffold16546_cov19-Tisochrysis_lutea.AAC.1
MLDACTEMRYGIERAWAGTWQTTQAARRVSGVTWERCGPKGSDECMACQAWMDLHDAASQGLELD